MRLAYQQESLDSMNLASQELSEAVALSQESLSVQVSTTPNLSVTDQEAYQMVRPGSQPISPDLKNVASTLSGLASITQNKKDQR